MVKSLLILLLLLIPLSASGQNYDFSIPEFKCVVEVNRDRSLDISYDIFFECTPGYSSIDIVDIGFPSSDFSLSDVEAGVDSHTLSRIYYSTYIDNGVEVHLDGNAIHSGEQGHFRFTGVNRDMVFLDTEEDDYASMEFSPTWFDGGILSGSSDFTLIVVFPPGADPDLVRHHARPFTSSTVDKDGRVVYTWEETRRVDSKYIVGISFPVALVDGPLLERPGEPFLSEGALVALAGFAFFFLFFGFMILIIVKAVIKAKRRREEYLPPKLGLEGSGIRRGLTAPLAALLLEEKLDRIFVLIVFGLLKKGSLQFDEDQLEKTGLTDGLRSYEKELLALFPDGPSGKPVPEEEIRKIFLGMIEVLEKKMEGFSLKETQAYYRSVIESAWKMVSADRSAEKAGEILGERFQWLLADGKYDSRARKLPSDTDILLPMYMYGFFPGTSRMIHGSSSTGGMNLSQACTQVAGALERTAGNAVSNITRLSSSVTAKTNPVPVSTSRGSSGGGCACACACAGCACACAGGGR
ncbi:MAG: hypothetical protein KAH54_04110 [Candidatus Sabulitectum sp.]|nr:hypothetical protein [Candidatus Sabulitectum sp.]